MKEKCNHEEPNKYKEIIHKMIWFSKKHRKIMHYRLDETGVFQSQHHILMEVSRNPNISQKELAEKMEISTATVAVTLKKLESGGYINRAMDKADNRLNLITITAKGNEVVKESKEIFHYGDYKVLKGFTEEEMDTLLGFLQRMDDNLSELEIEFKTKDESKRIAEKNAIQQGKTITDKHAVQQGKTITDKHAVQQGKTITDKHAVQQGNSITENNAITKYNKPITEKN